MFLQLLVEEEGKIYEGTVAERWWEEEGIHAH
jgi:hypothetical protein